MISTLITAARFGWAAVTGVDALTDAVARTTVRMALRSREIDQAAADEMVRRMQAAVPRDTGRLFSGIAAELVGEVWTVRASATHGRGRWDDLNYAFLVEHGTKAGTRGRRGTAVEPGYFDAAASGRVGRLDPHTGRRARVAETGRRAARTHPGTAPQPFFYPAVDAVMEERRQRQADALGEASL